MKKILSFVLSVMLIAVLAGCSSKESGGSEGSSAKPEKSSAPVPVSEPEKSEKSEPVKEDVFAFEYDGVKLVPGDSFDAKELREASSLYVVPSCAIDGEDNVYNYDSFELTAFSENDNEYIYSIYFIDPNLTTAEGLALGDSFDRAKELYGTSYEETDGQVIYTKGKTLLILILDGDVVNSIEYRLDI